MSNEGLEIDIDLSGDDINAWGGEQGPMLPEGTYTMDISAAEQKPSRKNQPTLKVTFKVADEGSEYGKEIFKSYSLQPKALGRIKNLMIAANARLDKIRPDELVGARVLVDIVHVNTPGTPDSEGNLRPDRMLCDIVKERALDVVEAEPPPPPPAAKGKAAPVMPKGNGQPAARRA